MLFAIALVVGVPVIAGATAFSKKLKYLALIGMVVSFMFNSQFSINLVSMEQYRGPVRGFEIALADIICLGLIFGMLLRTGSLIVWKPRFTLLLLGFFIFSVANVYFSLYRIYGWFAIWQLFRMGVMYWCITNFFATEEYSIGSIRALMVGYVATAMILGMIAFKQKYVDGIYRIGAFFDHSNTLPSFSIIFLCAILVWFLHDRDLKPIQHLIALVSVLAMTFAILATGSRTGMMTAAGSIVAGLGISNLRGRGNTRVRFTTIFLLFCMLIGGLLVIDTVIDRFLNAPESSEEARNEFEIAAIMMADDNRFGVGLNQYSQTLTVTERYRKHIKIMQYEEQAGVAHHIYLLSAAELGYIGMAYFILIIALFIFSMGWYGLTCKSLEQRLLLALAVGFCAIFAIGLFEWVLRQTPVLYQLVVAAGFGQALITKIKLQKSMKKREQHA